jgi:hypothetical protein
MNHAKGVKKMLRLLRSKKGEGYVDVIIIVMSAMLVIALVVSVFPVFIAKQSLDTFADKLLRTAEIAGQIGNETDTRITQLAEQTGIIPSISWSGSYISGTKKIQLNGNINVTLTHTVDIGLFGNIGSFPVTLVSKATGRSEVYWKGY